MRKWLVALFPALDGQGIIIEMMKTITNLFSNKLTREGKFRCSESLNYCLILEPCILGEG
jgi:hypothetical protein